MVTILMPTYNGESHLKAQLESIANQSYENWRLVVGDDGSCDGTLEILEKFKQEHPGQVKCINQEPPTGSEKKNLLHLLRNSHGPYFMFCQQNSVWKKDKIYLTLQKMEALEERYGKKTPILVHTDFSLVDDNVEMMAESFFQYAHLPKRILLNQLMVENSVTECTVMMNRSLQEYFLRSLPTNKMIDCGYWAALIAKVFGRIGFVNEPTMFYRQEAYGFKKTNFFVTPVSTFYNLKEQKHSYRRIMIESMEQINGFVDIYGEEMDDLDDYELLKAYGELYYKGKISRLAFYKNKKVLKEGKIGRLFQWLWG